MTDIKDLPNFKDMMESSLNSISRICFDLSRTAGWWDAPVTAETKPTKICLMHSELSEAMEGARKNINDDHLPHRKMEEVELADCLIRIFDYAGKFDLDLGGAVYEKLVYNQTRADHKKENREKVGGKQF